MHEAKHKNLRRDHRKRAETITELEDFINGTQLVHDDEISAQEPVDK